MTNLEPIEHIKCRSCGCNNLKPILSLGNQYPSNFVDSDDGVRIPLELVICSEHHGGCGLLQLKHTTPRDLLYKKYWFRSGLNETMKEALYDITKRAQEIIFLKENDIVLDIGCNDGTLLRSYSPDLKRVGFEPALNLIEDASMGGNIIVNDYFSYKEFNKRFPEEKCKIITSIAMFYDLEDPNTFVNYVAKCLDKKGIWIIQMAYLPSMLEKNAFDNIGHEHIEYYSLRSLKHLIEKHHLTIFNAELNDVYGGSIRAYIKHKDNDEIPIDSSVEKMEKNEEKLDLDKNAVYQNFADRVKEIKEKTLQFIKTETKKGKKIYAYGASTKGNTLLQFFELDSSLIEKAVDRDPNKWNKKTIGTGIPIISEEQAREENPDYFLILPWHLVEYFKIREKKYLEKGGKFIVPLPELQIIE